MKKKLNTKNKYSKKIIICIVILIFGFYIINTIVLSNRKYLYIESISKTIYNKINGFVVKNIYSLHNYSNNLTSSREQELIKENNNLKKLLNLNSSDVVYVNALVVNHTINNNFNKLEIKVNSNKIRKNSAVVNESGLIGFISKVSRTVSEVNLLTNVNSTNMHSVFIKTNEKDIAGVLRDYDATNEVFIVTDVIDKNTININDKVVLSGYQNGYRGLYIGKVVNIKISDHGLTRTLWVKSDVNFNDLLYVAVVGEK